MSKRAHLIWVSLVLVTVIGLTGCKKETEATSTPAEPDAVQTETVAAKVTVEAGEQTTCPVMGGDIDKAFFVEHKDKKVYFCCEPCKGKFTENPDKYMASLPQFK